MTEGEIRRVCGPVRRAAVMRGLLLGGAALAALGAGAARAQSAAANPPAGAAAAADAAPTVQDIVVTANKRAERANAVPMSITAATRDVLVRQKIEQPRDLARITPSFTYADSYVGSPIYTLRGVGFSDISLGGRSTVGIYVDEAPIAFPIETLGAGLDLERVEVLKGPQGTLFGQNATGGAINYIAAKPTQAFEAGAKVGYGNFNAVEAGGYVSGPVSDTLSARIAVDHTQNDAWQRSYTTGAKNGVGNFTDGRLILAWTPSSRFRAQLDINGFYDNSDVQAGQLIAITPSIPAAAGFVPGLLTYPLAPHDDTAADFNPGQDYRRRNGFIQANLRLDYDLGAGMTLTSLTSASHYSQRQLQDIDGTTLSNLSQLTVGHIDSVFEELRLAGEIGQAGHFVAGVNYAHDQVAQDGLDNISQSTTAFTFAPFMLPLFTDFRDRDSQDETTAAVFASGDYRLIDDVRIYGGLRYTRAIDRFEGCTADTGDGIAALDFGTLENVFRAGAGLPPNAPIPAGGCVTANALFAPGLVRNTLDQNNLSWRAGAEWTPSPSLLLYANVSRGYKAGGFPDLAASLDTQFLPATQESLTAYEGGFKTTLLQRTLQLNGAVFYYDYTDKQILGKVLDPVFGPLLRLINVPKSRITGAELQLTWTPVRGLTINAGGDYIDSEVLGGFVNYDATGALRNFNGEAFPNTPRWQFVSDIDYRHSLTDALVGFVGGGVTYEGPTNSQLGELPLLRVEGYALVDLRGGVESADGAWRIWAWGRNITNAYYWTAANANLDTTVRFTGMPATYGVTLTYRYR
ncbi:MAG TPA: TonB-dependent receptor [Caulobacteraceae bacterium]|jgi:outer membrane receptor protein involved in Fe transport|nr:TonB-dependent receptor [Caulobacteraceae bacterium]